MNATPVRRRATLGLSLLALAAACAGGATDDANIARGRGLRPAALTPAAEASVIDAATRAAFEVGPDLVLLLHPRHLPREAGIAGGDSVPSELVQILRDRGVVQGVCLPRHDVPRDTPHCGTPRTGYVVRTSPVLRMPGDTVEVYFSAEAFGPDTGPRPVSLRFEKIYQLVGRGESWRVAREARVKGE